MVVVDGSSSSSGGGSRSISGIGGSIISNSNSRSSTGTIL